MALLSPLTELEAVNLLLETVGEQPCNSLLDTGITEIDMAVSLLKNTSRSLQMVGWSFNTDTKVQPTLNSANNVVLAANVLKASSSNPYKNLTQRGNRLYDKDNHTYVFETSPYLNLVYFLDFEEIPQAARNYITVMAAIDFKKKVLGSETLTSVDQSDVLLAKQLFLEAEDDSEQFNVFDSYDTARPINRYVNPIPYGRY